jgi:ascorbate-specific PTS system EIIC-type component UlaA
MNIFTYLNWVKKLWTMVVDIVKLIEETIPDDGAGKEKSKRLLKRLTILMNLSISCSLLLMILFLLWLLCLMPQGYLKEANDEPVG